MDKKDLQIAAELAQIALSQDDFVKLGNALSEMLGYFDKIKSFKTQGLEPLCALVEGATFRLEEPQESVLADELIQRAPLEDRFVVVPNVL